VQLLDEYKLIPAKVVTNSISDPDNLITIDKGRADGVKVDMGVACGNGVVGVVYMVGLHYSIVIPLLNSHSHLSVAIERSGFFGSLNWTGGAPDVADMLDVPRHARFRWGDRVVTSGYSSIFPPGVLVGRVLHVYNSHDGLSYRVQVKLATDFGRLRDVCVIDNSRMQERIDLMRAAQDSIKPIER
jgi:rod shape-determining protein MreC